MTVRFKLWILGVFILIVAVVAVIASQTTGEITPAATDAATGASGQLHLPRIPWEGGPTGTNSP